MKCPNCGRETEGARFCPDCGTRLEETRSPVSVPEEHATAMEDKPEEHTAQPDAVPGAPVPSAETQGTFPQPGFPGNSGGAEPPSSPPQYSPPPGFSGENGMPPDAGQYPPVPQWQPMPPKKNSGGKIALIAVLCSVGAILLIVVLFGVFQGSREPMPPSDPSSLPSVSLSPEEYPPSEEAGVLDEEFLGCTYQVPSNWEKQETSDFKDTVSYRIPSEEEKDIVFSLTVSDTGAPAAFADFGEMKEYAEALGEALEGYEKIDVSRATVDGNPALSHTFRYEAGDEVIRCDSYYFGVESYGINLQLVSRNCEPDYILEDLFATVRSSFRCDGLEEQLAPSSAAPESSAKSEEAPKTSAASAVWTDAGMYKVGEELPAGTYYLECTEEFPAYYAVYTDSTGSFDSLVSNGNVSTFAFFTVSDGQYLEITRGRAAPQDQIPAIGPKDGKYIQGTYRVGVDIPAGEYNVKNDGSMSYGYYAVLNDATGNFDSIADNDNFESNSYVTVSEGQYLELSGAYIDGE